MAYAAHLHSKLVQDLVGLLLSKFENLPPDERKNIAQASIEAAAWVAAMESTGFCKKNGLDKNRALERVFDFENLFAAQIEQDLADNFYN